MNIGQRTAPRCHRQRPQHNGRDAGDAAASRKYSAATPPQPALHVLRNGAQVGAGMDLHFILTPAKEPT